MLKPLDTAPSQAYICDTLQVADILQWILSQSGPADIRISSFSISDEFLRRLFVIRESGLVRSLDIVLDFKATNKTRILWPFIARTVSGCYLTNNHSKIILVSGEKLKTAVVTSQNLTRGNRYESGFITTDPGIFASLSGSLDDIIRNHSVPFHEIYAKTARGD